MERRVWNEKGRERGVSDVHFPGGNVIALWNVWGGLLDTRVSGTLGESGRRSGMSGRRERNIFLSGTAEGSGQETGGEAGECSSDYTAKQKRASLLMSSLWAATGLTRWLWTVTVNITYNYSENNSRKTQESQSQFYRHSKADNVAKSGGPGCSLKLLPYCR